MCSALPSTREERPRHYGAHTVKTNWQNGAGTANAETVQPGEKKVQGILPLCINT